jgi:hypothetical protein
MTITDSDFDRNETGVLNMSDPDRDRAAQLTDVRFSDNRAHAIQNGGSMRLTRAQLDGNGRIDLVAHTSSAAIYNLGRMTIIGPTTIQGSPGVAILNGPDRPAMLSLIGVTILGAPNSVGVEHDQGHMSISGSVILGGSRGISQWGGTSVITSSVIADQSYHGISVQQPGGSSEVGTMTLRRSAVIRGAGTGIEITGRMSLLLDNSTVSGNGLGFQGDPRAWGGIFNWGGSLTLLDSTIAANIGLGLSVDDGGTATVRRSILVANSQAECEISPYAGAVDFEDQDFACDDTATLASLGLGPLTEMAGTFVHPILDPSSSLVDSAGAGCSGPDQAGTERPQLAGCDFGAFELPATTMSLDITPIPLVTITPTAAGPVFTFTQQANCRKGPNTLYESLGFGQVGEQVSIQGLSDPAGWYYVQLPAGTRCFAAGSTGDVSGLLDDLPVIPAPPLPVLATSTPPAPAAPSLSLNNQVCDATQYVVRMGWKDVEGETGYRVYRDGGLIATLAANATIYDDTSPDYNAHDYRVEAYNDAGTSSSATVSSEGCLY